MSAIETSDGGCLVGTYFSSASITIGGYNLIPKGSLDGLIIKYSKAGSVEWLKDICGTSDDRIVDVTELNNGTYIANCYYSSQTLNLERGKTLNKISNNYQDTGIIHIVKEAGVQEAQELNIKNERKTYKVTTDIKEINNIKGGTISGEDLDPYETVKYGDSNINEIKMIPDENYEIIEITVNGEDWPFTAEADGSYTMPAFENITENKNIVVKFALSTNKVTINKIDSISGEGIEGATLQLDQIEERTEVDADEVIDDLTVTGPTYIEADYDKEVTGVLGSLSSNEEYRFVEREMADGTTSYVPTNSRTYQLENGGTEGIAGTASSYMKIDLTGLDGTYKVVVNGYQSSRGGYDLGFATINQSEETPAYSNAEGRFIYMSGTTSIVTEPKDYQSTVILEGGETYYLHIGYRKAATSYDGDDWFVVNSIKLYETKEVRYGFTENEGKIEPTNQGKNNTVCNSFIPIDLSTYTGKYNLIVNAETRTSSGDYGYAILNTTESPIPEYNDDTDSNIKVLNLTGTNAAKDYVVEIDGGYEYYLHLGYFKDNSYNVTNYDVFRINSIRIELNDSELYHSSIETNQNGKAITQIPYGKYRVTEIVTPEGYYPLEEPAVIEFRSGGTQEFNIENEKICSVTVHHYIKGTDIKVSKDEVLEGHAGDSYTTNPSLDTGRYELEMIDGEPVLPSNRVGEFSHEDIEVNYYYVAPASQVIVHHYIEGSSTPVPLKNGLSKDDELLTGSQGESYVTEPVPEEELDELYELTIVPDNASGTFNEDEIEVSYYYKIISRDIIITKVDKDTREPIENARFNIYEGDYGKIELGELFNAGDIYEKIEADKGEEVLANIVWFDDLYANIDGKHIAKNCDWYKNNYDDGLDDEWISTNIDVDLSDKEGIYVISIAVEKQTTERENWSIMWPNNFNAHGNTLETDSSITKTFDYVLEGGQIYNFVVENRNYIDNDDENEYFAIENITVYKGLNPETTLVNNVPKIIEGDPIYEEEQNLDIRLITFSNESPFVEENGEYIPIVCEKYIEENNIDINDLPTSYAESYLEIDLSDKEGYYSLTFDVNMNSSNYYLYGTIYNENSSWEELIFKDGVDAETGECYENHNICLEGGQKYYLELDYNKYSNGSSDEMVKVKNFKLYKANAIVKEVGFDKTKDGKYVSNIQGHNNTITYAVLPIDLTNVEGPAQIIVNAQISSEYDDRGRVYITDNILIDKVMYNEELLDIGGDFEAEDYIVEVEGGKKYYLIFEYNKNWDDYSDVGEDKFTINSVDVETDSYYTVYTNQDGIAKITLPKGRYTVVEKKALEGYNLPQENAITVELGNQNVELLVENEKQKGEVIVHHYLKDTEEPITLQNGSICEDEIKTGPLGERYATKPKEDRAAMYVVTGSEGETSGEYIDGTIEVTYYYEIDPNIDKDVSYTIRYFKDDVLQENDTDIVNTTIKVLETEIPVDKDRINTVDKYPGYTLATEKTGIPDVIEDEGVIDVYYKAKDALLIIKYKEKGIDTDDVLIPDKEIGTKYFEEYSLEDYIETIDGYVLDREFVNEEFIVEDDIVIKTIYYEPKGKVIVHYVDQDNPDIDLDSVEKEDIVGEDYETYPISIDGYVLANGPDDPVVVITKDTQDVYYYYKKVSQGLIEKHIDEENDKILYEEVHTGQFGDEYEILPKEFTGYELDEDHLPTNSKGTLSDEVIEVIYYYNYISKVTIRYIDEDTGENLEDPTIIKGHVGDEYTSEQKEYNKYDFVKVEGNPNGTMTEEDIEVVYSYKKHQNKIIENHIDILDDEILFNEELILNEGDPYETRPINLDDYDVVIERLPANGSGEMGDEDIIINYYYIRKSEVNVEYLDFYTGKPVSEELLLKGHVGDEYTSQEENVPGYKLVREQLPENASGTMTRDPITVTYFYVKEAKVIERHIYKGNTLYEETHNGLEGEEYNIPPKDFEEYYVDENRLPNNYKGYMGEKEITVTYYYIEKAIVIEKHIDEDTKEILAYEKHEGRVGDKYKVTARKFPGYSDEYSCTDNNMGLMTEEPIEVIYWYKKVPKKETPAKEVPKAQEPQAPVTVIVQDRSGNTKSTVTAKSGDTVVVDRVTPKVDPDYEVVRNVPNTDSETNRIFYVVAAGLVFIGVVIIVTVGIINKKKSKE